MKTQNPVRKSWRVGQRVVFQPNAVSLAMYSSAPAPGSHGSVVAVSVGSKKVTYLPGPGGGLVYVNWDDTGVMGVSPIDLQTVKSSSKTKAKKNPSPSSKYWVYVIWDGSGWSKLGEHYRPDRYERTGNAQSASRLVLAQQQLDEQMRLMTPRNEYAYAQLEEVGPRSKKILRRWTGSPSTGWTEQTVTRKPGKNPAPNPHMLPADSNPVLTVAQRKALPASAFADPKNRRFPLHDMEHARAAVGKLNMWFKRGHISKEEYKEFYQRMMKAYSKYGLTAQKAPLVQMPRVIKGGKIESKPGLRKRAVGENPSCKDIPARKHNPASPELEKAFNFPIRNRKQAHGAIIILNNLYLKGRITDEEYRPLYDIIASAWKKFGIKGAPSNESLAAPAAPNPAKTKRHLPVLQPYSPEWRQRRAANIAQANPDGPSDRHDPSGMRAIMQRAFAKQNPVSEQGNANLAVQMSVSEMGMQADAIGKNISSIDPMEYFDTFVSQNRDPDAAMAALEDMASWGVTDEV